MSEHKNILVESAEGTGTVFLAGVSIATARYLVKVTQDIIVAGSDEIPGMRHVSGSIMVIGGQKDLLLGQELILHLADGRQWAFFAVRGDFLGGQYECVNVVGKGLTTGEP